WLWRFCISSSWLAPLLGFGSFALVSGAVAVGMLPTRIVFLAALLMLLMSIWWGVGYHFRLHAFSSIHLQQSRPKTGWVSRHRYILAIFAAGLALGGLVMLLLGGFLRSGSL